MLQVALDPARLGIAVAGIGPAASRRRDKLSAGGASPLDVDQAAPDFSGISVLWIADLPDRQAIRLARAAREAGVLVNVEDRPELCDFHSVAELRRGALLIGVSTGGESPGLARRIRDLIAIVLGVEWEDRVARIGALRRKWRVQNRPAQELARLTDDEIERRGWLSGYQPALPPTGMRAGLVGRPRAEPRLNTGRPAGRPV